MPEDKPRPLSHDELARFAQVHGAIGWCTYTGPMWPGAMAQNQYLRVLVPHHDELRTLEYYKPLNSISKQLHFVQGTEAPLTRSQFAELYGQHGITWREK